MCASGFASGGSLWHAGARARVCVCLCVSASVIPECARARAGVRRVAPVCVCAALSPHRQEEGVGAAAEALRSPGAGHLAGVVGGGGGRSALPPAETPCWQVGGHTRV